MSAPPKIYCDTCTLVPNVKNCPTELEAVKQLRKLRRAGKCSLYRSHIALGELERTKNRKQRKRLKADYKLLKGILRDEKLLGIRAVFNQFGMYANAPIFSDVQDEKVFVDIYHELKRRLPHEDDFRVRRDAEHVAQAISDNSDVFLTRDRKTIIGPLREWLEQRYLIKVRLPSEALAEIEQEKA